MERSNNVFQLKGRLRLPVIGAPLFLVSGVDLVLAQCRAGIIGSFPALNARPAGVLDDWLCEIEAGIAMHDRAHPESLAAPFAVNLIVNKSNDRLEEDLETCVRHKVPIVVTSLGARSDVNEEIHAYGGTVIHDVTNLVHARKAVERGADGLVAVAAGAGGHAGTLSPFAIVQEIRSWWGGPLALSGAIANGASILAAQVMGADFAYIGSAFIATEEAHADAAYKQMILHSSASDIIYTDHFSGIPANYLRPSLVRMGLDPNELVAQPQGVKAWRDIWGAGHGIGSVNRVESVASLVARWREEYLHARSVVAGTDDIGAAS